MSEKHQVYTAQHQLDQFVKQYGLPVTGKSKGTAELKANARQRLHRQELIRQKNIEAIFQQAEGLLGEHTGTALDPDWQYRFVELAQHICQPQMQTLWSKILAVELMQPQRFSVKTLSILREMTKQDAVLLRQLAAMSTYMGDATQAKVILGYSGRSSTWQAIIGSPPPWEQGAGFGFGYSQWYQLIELGLVYRPELETAELDPKTPVQCKFGDYEWAFRPRHKGLKFRYHRLTDTGNELISLIPKLSDASYLDGLADHLSNSFVVQRPGVDEKA